jgi:hypothetical protein
MGSSLPLRLALCIAIPLSVGFVRAENAPTPPPLNPGLTEGVESRLVQFEVRVSRKGVPVRGLTAQDLDIELSGKPLAKFTIDDMCTAAPSDEIEVQATRPGSFVFYFDEPELTVEGRLRAIEVARLVAPALLAKGHDVMVLRNGASLHAETKWTHDAAEVTAALDRIAADPGHRDSLQAAASELQAERLMERAQTLVRESEYQRQSSMMEANSEYANGGKSQGGGGTGGGMSAPWDGVARNPKGANTPGSLRAFKDAVNDQEIGNASLSQLASEFRTLVQDELQRSGRDVERLRGAVRALSLRGSPKGLVYFADTLRRDPGGVVARALGSVPEFNNRKSESASKEAIADWNSDGVLAALVRDAATYDVRFYSVEGRGLGMPTDWVRSSQDTIAGLALETGGLYFVNGIAGRGIAESIAADQSCWYLVSFEPAGWSTDRPLNVGVWPKQQGLHVQTRSALVIPSRAALTQTRLLAAHFGDPGFEDHPLSVSIYPIGGTADDLNVLAQLQFPDEGVPPEHDTGWEIGFDVVSMGTVVAHNSHRVTWRGNGRPPIYQTTLTLPPGPYEIIAVAHETATDSIRAGRVNGSWPPSRAGRVTLSLPAVAQPQRGGIVQDGEVRETGIVVRGAGNLVDPRQPVAMVTAACVSGSKDTVLRAERSIVGETEVSFAPMDLSSDEGRCVQIRDLIAARSLGAGRMTYFVRILSGEAEIASQELSFDVADMPAPVEAAVAPATQ